jgi:uncharacterized protein YdiU (UPF0061 family)
VDSAPTPLDQLTWDNRFVRELPADPIDDAGVRTVEHAAYSRVQPTPTAAPELLAWSPELAEQLGLDERAMQHPATVAALSGNAVPAGAEPFAMAYGGHQFGTWARQLGDGRAMALGEVVDRFGQLQTLQLKGAGPTPYSRFADGRAVLRSSIREFLCSEAMHHLGIPTTRALSLVGTGDDVVRDMLYDGHPAPEPGAVVCRVAPSFVRFGTFELPARRGDGELLAQLIEFAMRSEGDEALSVDEWFARVCERTAAMVVDWMRVGFVHGVLNTDNMSILGLTIDYGPYGWLEDFDPGWTPNTTDAERRRYRFGQQPQVAQWNLMQLANALVQHTQDAAPLQAALEAFGEQYGTRFDAMMVERLGWGDVLRDGDEQLWQSMFELLQRTEVDQVIWHRDLARVPVAAEATDEELLEPLAGAWYRPEELVGEVRAAFVAWLRVWGARVRVGGLDDAERRRRMDAVNPRFVLRNWLAQEAIDAAHDGDLSRVHELQDVLRRPYEEQPGRDHFAARRPEWARTRVGSSMLSCSS